MDPMLKQEARQRLKTAYGHLASVQRMVEDDVYCVNVMKQVAAVSASLEQVQRILLQNHLATCVADAVDRGHGREIVAELLDAMKVMPFSTAEAVEPNGPLHPLVGGGWCRCHPAAGQSPSTK